MSSRRPGQGPHPRGQAESVGGVRRPRTHRPAGAARPTAKTGTGTAWCCARRLCASASPQPPPPSPPEPSQQPSPLPPQQEQQRKPVGSPAMRSVHSRIAIAIGAAVGRAALSAARTPKLGAHVRRHRLSRRPWENLSKTVRQPSPSAVGSASVTAWAAAVPETERVGKAAMPLAKRLDRKERLLAIDWQ